MNDVILLRKLVGPIRCSCSSGRDGKYRPVPVCDDDDDSKANSFVISVFVEISWLRDRSPLGAQHDSRARRDKSN